MIRQLKITSQNGGSALALELDGALYYPLRDLFGNTVSLLNAQGECIEQYRYTVFGEEKIFSQSEQILKSSVENPWRYACKRLDPDTGLVAFGLREYDPTLGRWITPDPAGFDDGPNLYAYVHNRPLTYFDAYGLFSITFGDGRSSLSDTLWNSVGGALHGGFDFAANQFYAMNSLCCMIGAHEMDCSPEERFDSMSAFSQSQADFASTVDAGIQQFLRVDPNCAAYQNSRYYTAMAIETGACLTGAYGLAKGAVKGAAGFAARRSAAMTQRAALKTVEKTTSFTQNSLEAFQITGRNATRNAAELDLNALSKAGQTMDRNGLTRAGRALDKHGGRQGSVFPKATGNSTSKNIQGQFQLDDILTNPYLITKPNKFGGLNLFAPDGRGACFNAENNFRGFLQP